MENIEEAEDILLVVISKSGTTLETLTNAQYVYQKLVEKFGEKHAAEQTVVVANDTAPIHAQAEEKGFSFLPIPEEVGGRFSVFTPAGLFPLAVAGIAIEDFLSGARDAITSGVNGSTDTPSGAHLRAALLFEAWLKKLPIHELFLFHPRLEMLGKWYRQLLAESIGKRQQDGTPVGLMPTVALGSTDLHSLGQLIFGGPLNRITTFIAIPSLWEHEKLPVEHVAAAVFGHGAMDGAVVGDLPHAIYGALKEQYVAHDMPHMSVEFATMDAREIGAYMGLEFVSVMLLGELLGVNTFNQPAVEEYKERTRKRLASLSKII
jgi:glucose-6-phosphate isomerase